jgi:hypothetical protein
MPAARLGKVGTVAFAQGVPGARSVQWARLWARQAWPSQAALAVNVREGTWARPPALTSRVVSFTPAWPR